MSTWKRFWLTVLGWSAALCVLLGAYSLLVHFTNDIYRGPGAIMLDLHYLASGVGLYFPLIVFLAALGTAPALRSVRRVVELPAFVGAPMTAGALHYLWLAFAEPWTRVWLFRWTAGLAGQALDPAPVASTQVWFATQLSNPALDPAGARLLVWLFHQPIALGLLTFLLGIAGFLLGRRATTGAQRWSVAALVGVVVGPMLLASLRLTTRYEVPPVAAVYGVLLLPLFLLAVLGWIDWTDRERTALAAIS
jgi:hypothetical protein